MCHNEGKKCKNMIVLGANIISSFDLCRVIHHAVSLSSRIGEGDCYQPLLFLVLSEVDKLREIILQ